MMSNMLYTLNIIVLSASFIMSILLFIQLFAHDSVAYRLGVIERLLLKGFLILLSIGQLHSIDGCSPDDIHTHDVMRGIGQFGLILFTHLYLLRVHKSIRHE